MKRIILAISVVCALATTACTDLTEKVYSSLTQSSYNYSPSDLRPSIDACYAPMRSYIGHGQLWAMDCTSSDEIVMPPNSTGWDDGGIYRRMHYHSWNSEQSHISSAWGTTYQGIGLCNSLLAQLDENQLQLDEATNKAAIAEVRAIRAYYYSIVCDVWGDAPLVKEISEELPEKAARKDIYDFVVKELSEVIGSLSDEQGGSQYGHINKWAATALLAKMYLNAGVYAGSPAWSDAEAQCDAIINSKKFELSPEYKDCFKDDQAALVQNKEVIFTIPFDTSLASFSMYFFSWGAPVKAAFNTGGTPWGSGCAMGIPQFIDTYDPDDNRLGDTWLIGQVHKYKDGVQNPSDGEPIMCIYDAKDGSFPPLAYVNEVQSGHFSMEWEGYRMNKFEVKAGDNGMGVDFPITRYAEILLMKAECMLRQNKPGAAEYVNMVRERAFDTEGWEVTDDILKGNSKYKYYSYASDYAKTTTPGDQSPVVLGGLYDEYGWEFAWEMGTRTRMIRFGTYTTKNWLSHEADGDKWALFPIPFSALTANPKLVQNPNYD